MNDLGALLVCAFVAAFILCTYWKEVLALLVVLVVTAIFAGILGMAEFISSIHPS